MTKDKELMTNEQLLKIEAIDITAYEIETEKERLIKTFEPDYKQVVNSNRALRDYLAEINLIIKGLYKWLTFLLNIEANFKANNQLSTTTFKAAYKTMYNNNLLAWLPYYFDLPQLYTDITGDTNWTLEDETWQIKPTLDDKEKLSSLQFDIEVIEGLLKSYMWWAEILVTWHYHRKISPAVFEDTYITLARRDILGVYYGSVGTNALYKAVTGEEADTERLDQIYELFNPYA